MAVDCPTCGREFSGERGMRVHHVQAHGERLPNRECARCGDRFYSEEERKYCTESCLEASISYEEASNPNYRGGKETTDCEICGEEFEYYPSEKPGRFCPDCVETEDWHEPPSLTGPENPHYRGGKIELECDVCDAEFERYPSNVGDGAILCSNECRAEWLSEAFTGEGHPNWKGGGNEDYGPEWARVRAQALERDDHRCVVCRTTKHELGRNPDVHHVVPVRRFVESPVLTKTDAHTLDNLVSLCAGCHRRAEFDGISAEWLRLLVRERSTDSDPSAAPEPVETSLSPAETMRAE